MTTATRFEHIQQAVAAADAAAASGDVAAAVAVYGLALQQWPEHPALLFNLGATLAGQGQAAAAADVYTRAVARAPEFAPAHHNLANALRDSQRGHLAAASYRQALLLDPTLLPSRIGLAQQLLREGHGAQAVSLLQQGLQLQPSHAGLWAELGQALETLGDRARALECHRQALALAPQAATSHHNVAVALQNADRTDEALPFAQRAVALDPGLSAAQDNLGNILAQQGDLAGARQALAKAARLQRSSGLPGTGLQVRSALLLPAVSASREAIAEQRAQFAQSVQALAQGQVQGRLFDPAREVDHSSAFYLAYHGLPNRELMVAQAAMYRALCPALGFQSCERGSTAGAVGRPVRVGIVSRYLREHTVGRYLIRLAQQLARPEFQLCLFTWPAAADRMSEAFKAAADEYRLLPAGLADAQRVLADAQLDVLVYADIGMEPSSYFLAFARLAPVQCAFYGHPDTTGLDTIDHFLSWAPAETPASADWYHEPLALLPQDCTYACLPRPAALPAAASKPDLGLSADDHLYLCVQAPYKVHPDFDDLAAGVLTADPSARVALVGRGLRAWNSALERRLRERLGPLADRLHVLPERAYADYLALLGAADVVLDTPHFNGGATTLDAVAMGTPVVTLPGAVLRSRQTLAVFQRLGVLDGIASSSTDYVERAVDLARDTALRESVSSRMQAAQGAVFEDLGMVRALEALMRQWTGRCD